jgi:hypothetical protein
MLPPLRGSMDETTPQPLADARGYVLSPLRGCSAYGVQSGSQAWKAAMRFHNWSSAQHNQKDRTRTPRQEDAFFRIARNSASIMLVAPQMQ